VAPARLVAAGLALVGNERGKQVGWPGRIDRCQHGANRPICAENTQNYAENCGAADEENDKKCVQLNDPYWQPLYESGGCDDLLYPHLTPVVVNN
jgi:hypothetical protein